MDRISIIAGLIVHLAFAIAAGLFPFLLADRGITYGGKCMGWATLVMICLSFTPWLLASSLGRRWIKPVLLIGVLVMMGLLAMAVRLAPSAPDHEGQFTEQFLGKAKFRRFSPANLVPEIDQLKLGTYLFPAIDPYLTGRQARQVRQAFLDVYMGMRRQADFVQGGSALGMCYSDLFLADRRSLHLYQYLPDAPTESPGQARPVLLWLHGSLGNFKGYLWVLKEVADSLGMALVAPTYGMGNWQLDQESDIVRQALDYCQAVSELDLDQVYIGGISNGGRGTMRAVANLPEAFQGVVLISPLIEKEIIARDAFKKAGKDQPMFILHGEDDRRIGAEYVRDCAQSLHQMGADLKVAFVPEQDHFVMFADREFVVKRLIEWFEIRLAF